MTPTRHVTTALLLATFAVTGCSKRADTSQSKAVTPDVTPSKAAATAGETAVQIGEEGFSGGTPVTSGTVSFADA